MAKVVSQRGQIRGLGCRYKSVAASWIGKPRLLSISLHHDRLSLWYRELGLDRIGIRS